VRLDNKRVVPAAVQSLHNSDRLQLPTHVLQDALDRLMVGRTTVVVAHRWAVLLGHAALTCVGSESVQQGSAAAVPSVPSASLPN